MELQFTSLPTVFSKFYIIDCCSGCVNYSFLSANSGHSGAKILVRDLRVRDLWCECEQVGAGASWCEQELARVGTTWTARMTSLFCNSVQFCCTLTSSALASRHSVISPQFLITGFIDHKLFGCLKSFHLFKILYLLGFILLSFSNSKLILEN